MTQEQPTFSHSGQRYLLGYTAAEYAIWDRQAPGPPIRRFPKSDQGWNEAWSTYQTLEAPPSPAPEPAPAASPAPEPAQAPAAAPSAPTTPMPSAAPPAVPAGPPKPPFQINARLLSQALKISGWALLGLLPLGGIGFMTLPGAQFGFIAFGLALIGMGPAFWGICLTLAKVAERNG